MNTTESFIAKLLPYPDLLLFSSRATNTDYPPADRSCFHVLLRFLHYAEVLSTRPKPPQNQSNLDRRVREQVRDRFA